MHLKKNLVSWCFLVVLRLRVADAGDFEDPKLAKAGADLYNQGAATLVENINEKGNLIISSFSLMTAMGMVYLGTSGKTEEQMKSSLFNSKSKEEVGKLNQYVTDKWVTDMSKSKGIVAKGANRIWVDKSFKLLPEYEKKVKEYYFTVPRTEDFASLAEKARKDMNEFVANQTDNMLKDFLSKGSVSSSTKAVLINALYMKGVWATQFDPKDTEEANFHVDNKTKVKVQMMHVKSRFRWTVFDEGATALELPYKGGGATMVIVLPDEDKDLYAIEKKVYEKDFATMFERGPPRKAHVWIPRWKTGKMLDLEKTLKAMGNTHLFDNADLGGMTKQAGLRLSKVVQECIVEVNEEGTEAAAATAVSASSRSIPSPPLQFRVDRPFVFAIVEKETGLLAYSGRIVDPSHK